MKIHLGLAAWLGFADVCTRTALALNSRIESGQPMEEKEWTAPEEQVWTAPDPLEPQCRGKNYDPMEWSYYSMRSKAVRDSSEPWDTAATGESNMCFDGYFVPELMVLGTIQGSTTSLCAELQRSPNMLWPRSQEQDGNLTRDSEWKEGHYFDCHYAEGISFMQKGYGSCDGEHRKVAVDGSASYFSDFRVPPVISQWYSWYSMRHMLTFAIMLREPLERMHSHFYHSKAGNWCPLHKKMNFAQALNHAFRPEDYQEDYSEEDVGGGLPIVPPSCLAFLEASLYPKYLTLWFNNFPTKQFIIVPFKYNVEPGRSNVTVANFIWQRLGVTKSLLPEVERTEAMQANKVQHASLKEDLTEMRLYRVTKYFEQYSNPIDIGKILKNTDAHLFGYKGNIADDIGIAMWVKSNW